MARSMKKEEKPATRIFPILRNNVGPDQSQGVFRSEEVDHHNRKCDDRAQTRRQTTPSIPIFNPNAKK